MRGFVILSGRNRTAGSLFTQERRDWLVNSSTLVPQAPVRSWRFQTSAEVWGDSYRGHKSEYRV